MQLLAMKLQHTAAAAAAVSEYGLTAHQHSLGH